MDNLDILASRLPDGMVTTDAEVLRGRAIDWWPLAAIKAALDPDRVMNPGALLP